MLKAKFVEAEIIRWLQDTRPNIINPVEFYPVLARKIVEALDLYNKILDNE